MQKNVPVNFEIVSQMQSRRLRVELLLQSIEVATGLVKVIHGIILSYDFDSRICMTAACERISTRGPPTLCLAREVVDFDLRMLCFVHVEERLEHLQKSTKTQTGIFTVHCTYCCLTFYASHRCPANDCFAHDRRMCAFCKRLWNLLQHISLLFHLYDGNSLRIYGNSLRMQTMHS